jgi:hypothetical protein
MTDVSNVAGSEPSATYTTLSQTDAPPTSALREDDVLDKLKRGGKDINQDVKVKKQADEITKLLDEIAKNIEDQPPSNGYVLNRIIKLLIELTPVLQHLGKAEADHLTFVTGIQGVYTDLISKAPYREYSTGHDDQDKWEKERESYNQKAANAAESLRSFRDVWSNYAKQLQSGLNTVDEAVKQQTDLLTSFLQQLRELCSLITR